MIYVNKTKRSDKMEMRKVGRELHFIKGIHYNCNEMDDVIGLDEAQYLWFEEEATRSFFPRIQTEKAKQGVAK